MNPHAARSSHIEPTTHVIVRCAFVIAAGILMMHPYPSEAQVVTNPLTVSITTPTQGSVESGTVEIAANVSGGTGVVGVTFKIGARILGEDMTVPYTHAWDSTSVPNATARAVHAVARDSAGNVATSTRVIEISNAILASCTIGDVTVSHGRSRILYDSTSLPKGESCSDHGRTTTCMNGTFSTDQGWSPAFSHSFCTVQANNPRLDACAAHLPADPIEYWKCRAGVLIPWHVASTTDTITRIDSISHFPEYKQALSDARLGILGILVPLNTLVRDPLKSWTLDEIRAALQSGLHTRALSIFLPQVNGTKRADVNMALSDAVLAGAVSIRSAIEQLRGEGVPDSALAPIQAMHDTALQQTAVARSRSIAATQVLNSIMPDGGDQATFSANLAIRTRALSDIAAAKVMLADVRKGPLASARNALAALTPDPTKSCVQDGATVGDGRSRTFYDIQIATTGTSCAAHAQVRSCSDTVLSGPATHRFSTCSDIPTSNRVVRMQGKFFTELDPKETGRHSAPRYFTVEYSHPSDIVSAEENLMTSLENKVRECGVSGSAQDLDCILKPSSFGQDVIVKKTTIDVQDAPTDVFGLVGGDMCVSGVCLAAARVYAPMRDYSRSVTYPSGTGRFLKANEYLQAGTNLGVFAPRTLNPDNSDIADARITFTFEYAPASPSDAVQKFVKIPYLDTVLIGPEFIPANRPWYKPWSDTKPLVVRGIQTYGTNLRRSWPAESVCVMAIDAHGDEVPGKKICLPPQTYTPNTTSFGSEPIFVPGYFEVAGNERLSAKCHKAGDTGPADCVLYPLIDIPADYVASYSPRIKFHPDIVDKEYLVNGYCPIDMKLVRGDGITFAGRREIQFVIETEREPWKTLTANLPSNPNAALRKACEYLFEYPAGRGSSMAPAPEDIETPLGEE